MNFDSKAKELLESVKQMIHSNRPNADIEQRVKLALVAGYEQGRVDAFDEVRLYMRERNEQR